MMLSRRQRQGAIKSEGGCWLLFLELTKSVVCNISQSVSKNKDNTTSTPLKLPVQSNLLSLGRLLVYIHKCKIDNTLIMGCEISIENNFRECLLLTKIWKCEN